MFFKDREHLSRASCWQKAFIRDNFPVIGYYAWVGFQRMGWGLVVCHVEPPPRGSVIRLHVWKFRIEFVPGQLLTAYLQEMEILTEAIPQLVTAIARYRPDREIMLLIHSGGTIEVNWLKNQGITPPNC
ncbi:MAG: hypothetical protein KME35_23225 [Aphanocapsa sp. GSE-SYN-MK-11-07L]|jgi:hypothetical protein|nr:hypothetical protein [Aphanocapsa sp. GSE-SYN-MK-11-07L]